MTPKSERVTPLGGADEAADGGEDAEESEEGEDAAPEALDAPAEEAPPPPPAAPADDKTAKVQFKLCNAFDEEVPFSAYLAQDSSSVFAISPAQGLLPRAGTAGTLFTISYTPTEYGKQVRGTLIILTDEMQWSYDVRGGHPQYEAPRPSRSTVDHVLDPSLSTRLGRTKQVNFLKKNMDDVK